MSVQKLQGYVAGLAFANAALHFLAAISPMAGPLAAPLAGFGVANAVAAVLARRGRSGVIAAMAVCGIGLAIGGPKYLQDGGSYLMPVMFLIDAAVLALGAVFLARSKKS